MQQLAFDSFVRCKSPDRRNDPCTITILDVASHVCTITSVEEFVLMALEKTAGMIFIP